MGNFPVCWFEIYVQDMERAKTFYEKVLGVQLRRIDMSDMPAELRDMEKWGFPPSSDGPDIPPGALIRMPGIAPGANSTVIFFSCVDCGVEAGRVKIAGGKVLKEKHSINQYGFIAEVLDTEGNKIGLHSMQ